MIWRTLDYHVGGEAVRILVEGIPAPSGRSMMEKREQIKRQPLVQATIREPRGHAGMYAALITEPEHTDSAFGVLFACNENVYPLFCGHALLGAIRAAADSGRIPSLREGRNVLPIDAPSGQVRGVLDVRDGRILRTAFINEPCRVIQRDIEMNGLKIDLVWAGSFMAYVDAGILGDPHDLSIIPAALRLGAQVQDFLRMLDLPSPVNPALRTGQVGALICFVTPVRRDGDTLYANTLNIIDANNYDRGAAGTGTCGRLTLLKSQGIAQRGDLLVNTAFTGQHYDAFYLDDAGDGVLPELTAQVWPMGKSSFIMDESDPFPKGFL